MHHVTKPLALACALAACQTTFAQSGVTIGGTVDLAMNHSKGSLTSRTQMISGGNATSKLIFRGREDLGNGSYANFWLESGFSANSGAGMSVPNNNQVAVPNAGGGQGLTFNRRSFVGVGGAWGELRAGREWSPSYETFTGKYDPFALSIGLGMNYAVGIDRNAIRSNNALVYISPKLFSAVTVNLQHFRGEGTGPAGTEDNGTGSGIRVSYDKGPISAGAAYINTKFASGDAIYRDIAGAYDFGPVRLAFNVNRNQQAALRQKGFLIGLTAPFGATQLKASYSQFRANTAGDPKASKIALGVVHNLSKRTAVYGTVARISNDNGAAYAFTGTTTAANTSGRAAEVGIRHNF
jgi:predicted porin